MNLKVEMRKENDYYPRVVASPSDGKVVFSSAYRIIGLSLGEDQGGD